MAHQRGYDVRQGSATDIPFADASLDRRAARHRRTYRQRDRCLCRDLPRGQARRRYPCHCARVHVAVDNNDVINLHERRYTAPE